MGSDNPHTVVEGQPIDAIGFHDPLQDLETSWSVSPSLPPGLTMDPATGEITGSVEGELPDTPYTMTATEVIHDIPENYSGSGDAFMIKDSWPGSQGAYIGRTTAVGGTVFFASGSASGVDNELYKSDGTESGTVMVKDINPGGSSQPTELIAVGDTLFFRADDGTHGRELWKSDGTEAGTVMVKDIVPGTGSSGIGDSSYMFTAVGDIVFFDADVFFVRDPGPLLQLTSSDADALWAVRMPAPPSKPFRLRARSRALRAAIRAEAAYTDLRAISFPSVGFDSNQAPS